MNNRYTFKGKTKQGKWVYGNLLEPKRMYSFNGIDRSDKFCLIVESSFANGGWVTVGTKHWVLKETLCQFTGLQDKNGKEIYEYDIVKYLERPDYPEWNKYQETLEEFQSRFDDYEKTHNINFNEKYQRCFEEKNFIFKPREEPFYSYRGLNGTITHGNWETNNEKTIEVIGTIFDKKED